MKTPKEAKKAPIKRDEKESRVSEMCKAISSGAVFNDDAERSFTVYDEEVNAVKFEKCGIAKRNHSIFH